MPTRLMLDSVDLAPAFVSRLWLSLEMRRLLSLPELTIVAVSAEFLLPYKARLPDI